MIDLAPHCDSTESGSGSVAARYRKLPNIFSDGTWKKRHAGSEYGRRSSNALAANALQGLSSETWGFAGGRVGRMERSTSTGACSSYLSRLIDYVVLHEHIHLLHHNHSPDFWRGMDSVLPDWRDRKRELERDWGRFARFALAIFPPEPDERKIGSKAAYEAIMSPRGFRYTQLYAVRR